jgi:hypothetical protein
MSTTTESALASLNLCWLDLTAAHERALDAGGGLTGARQARAHELVGMTGDALAFCRRLAFVIEGDLRADQEGAQR